MSQKENILRHLQVYGSITPLEALQAFHCFRLGAAIFLLKKEGYDIKTDIAEGHHYAIYTLVGDNDK